MNSSVSQLNNSENASNPSNFIAYEGAEKKLEIDFQPKNGWHHSVKQVCLPLTEPKASIDERKHPNPVGMRAIPKKSWDKLLLNIGATILSSVSNEYCDAYLLSESSLFVYSYKVILKTCGETTLLSCLLPLLDLAVSLDLVVAYVCFARKNFHFQDRQKGPHKSFQDEERFLSQFFKGSSFILGPTNCHHYYVFLADYTSRIIEEDRMLEIMMTDIPKSICDSFTNWNEQIDVKNSSPDTSPVREGHQKNSHPPFLPNNPDAKDCSQPPINSSALELPSEPRVSSLPKTTKNIKLSNSQLHEFALSFSSQHGLDTLFPADLFDPWIFQPCGFSSNSLLNKTYATLHVTPEPEYSYVSFETNCFQEDYIPIIQNVLSVFQPKKAMIVFFNDQLTKPVSVFRLKSFLHYSLVSRQALLINGEEKINFWSVHRDDMVETPVNAASKPYLPNIPLAACVKKSMNSLSKNYSAKKANQKRLL